jgi:hypothetical protein
MKPPPADLPQYGSDLQDRQRRPGLGPIPSPHPHRRQPAHRPGRPGPATSCLRSGRHHAHQPGTGPGKPCDPGNPKTQENPPIATNSADLLIPTGTARSRPPPTRPAPPGSGTSNSPSPSTGACTNSLWPKRPACSPPPHDHPMRQLYVITMTPPCRHTTSRSNHRETNGYCNTWSRRPRRTAAGSIPPRSRCAA